jgi:hypothetical protein
MTVRQKSRITLAAGIVALVGLSLASGARAEATPVDAAPTETSQQVGQVTLFQNADFTGPVLRTAYTSCAVPRQLPVQGQVRSFANQPLAGCQVVLSRGVRSQVLCAGRGTVPIDLQISPQVRIQPGSSPACLA